MMKKKKKIIALLFICIVLIPGLIMASECTDKKGSCAPATSACSDGNSGVKGMGCPDTQMCCNFDRTGSPTPTPTPTTGSASFANPLAFNSIEQLLESVMNNLQGLLVTLAILFIVLGGVMYILSAGNEKMITRAKACWTGAVIGLAIALAAPTFLKEVRTILGATVPSSNASVESASTLSEIALRALNFLLSIVGIIAILALVAGGGMYLTSYGDDKRIETGKKIITYAIIGIVVALGAVVMVREVGKLIGVQWS